MNTSTSNWTRFELKIPVKADIPALYKVWATQEGIERWFLRSAKYSDQNGIARRSNEFVQRGDRYHWLWHGFSDANEKRSITDANGKDLFQFEFSGNCLVTVTLQPAAGAVAIVKLVQDRIPEDDNPSTNLFVGCQLGWTFYLANLKSIMEGGIDLRNRDVNLQQVVNA